VFAYALAKSQDQQRDDIQKRFGDRAEVAASVNESIFKLASDQGMQVDIATFGSEKVNAAALAARTKQQRSPYAAILSADGKVLAGSLPPRKGRDEQIQKALKAKRAEYSSIVRGPGGRPVIEAASPFETQFGTRIDLAASDAALIGQFLTGFLQDLPIVANAKSYVVDPMLKVIATPGVKSRPGVNVPDKDLAAALKTREEGNYGDGRYFTSDGIAGTPWRIVLTAAQSDLYESVETTVPWIIFGAFVLVAGLGLFLLRRVLLANAELERADLSRQHALEINDNVVQRLVLAKYALDRGATETSQQKLSETLRETQQLVTSLLEEKEIGPGSLRREGPAPTEGPPEPRTPSWQRSE
jgi:hypothetical protein